MSRAIGGTLDLGALAALSGVREADDGRMAHFHRLDRARQVEAIRRLALDGWSARDIAHATGLSVEQIARVLAEVPSDG